jgi:hypothetical protein
MGTRWKQRDSHRLNRRLDRNPTPKSTSVTSRATSAIIASLDHFGSTFETGSVYVPEKVSNCFELHIAAEESSDVPFLATCRVILDGRTGLMILRLRLKGPEGLLGDQG